MKRLLLASLLVYAPHLAEEHFTRIDDEPWMAHALAPFASMTPQHAAYFVFQVMLVLALAMTFAFSLGGTPRRLVMVVLGLSLLGESHHLVRFVASQTYNSGLVTSLPMPIVGALVFVALFFSKEQPPCSTTSSSPWGSGESPSA